MHPDTSNLGYFTCGTCGRDSGCDHFWEYSSNLEACWIPGATRVRAQVPAKSPEQIEYENWCRQGMPGLLQPGSVQF
jgi:hypothetical protein